MTEHIIARTNKCFQQAELFFQHPFQRPEISFKLRGKTAGMAHITKNLLRFNWQLYQDNKSTFLKQTVAHEVAHFITYAQYGAFTRPHGKEWQFVMQTIYHLPAERCHTFKTTNKPRVSFIYNCSCKQPEHTLSTLRHNRAQKNQRYYCRYCRSTLIFSGKESII